MSRHFSKSAKGALGRPVGTSIYQLLSHSESPFDFYRPVFISLVMFVSLYVYHYIFSPNNKS